MKNTKIEMEFRPANLCFSIAQAAHELARSAKDDWEKRHHLLTGVVFAAFSAEAMINHYAKIVLLDWYKIERKRRKDYHKTFFESVNLKGYLGKEPYQTIERCFELRDAVAHGKTVHEETQATIPKGIERAEELSLILSAPSRIESGASLKNLSNFIDAVKLIEKDIENNGYYPNQDGLPQSERRKLAESPLSVSGLRQWESNI